MSLFPFVQFKFNGEQNIKWYFRYLRDVCLQTFNWNFFFLKEFAIVAISCTKTRRFYELLIDIHLNLNYFLSILSFSRKRLYLLIFLELVPMDFQSILPRPPWKFPFFALTHLNFGIPTTFTLPP